MGQNSLGRLYKDGEVIIKQGTVGDCVFVIQKDPSIAFRLLERMSARLRETNNYISI